MLRHCIVDSSLWFFSVLQHIGGYYENDAYVDSQLQTGLRARHEALMNHHETYDQQVQSWLLVIVTASVLCTICFIHGKRLSRLVFSLTINGGQLEKYAWAMQSPIPVDGNVVLNMVNHFDKKSVPFSSHDSRSWKLPIYRHDALRVA